MTPHEVVKNSLEEFDNQKLIQACHCKGCCGQIKKYFIDSQLSLLYREKEMVESKKKNEIMSDRETMTTLYTNRKIEGYNQALLDLQSLLDTEINKVKEL